MESKAKYLISVYKEEDSWDTPNYYSLTVADVKKDYIVLSVISDNSEVEFEEALQKLIEKYKDCLIIFNNENLMLTRFLIDNYKSKLLYNETILYKRLYGWTPSKSNIDSFYLKENQSNMFLETFGALNKYLDKGYGR